MEDAIGAGSIPGGALGIEATTDDHVHDLVDGARGLGAAAAEAFCSPLLIWKGLSSGLRGGGRWSVATLGLGLVELDAPEVRSKRR